MPPKRRGTDAQGDRLGALPDDVLSLVLSFLPAEDAVRTCVLARRWLYQWKSATGLHIDRNVDGPESLKALRDFMEHLRLLRAGSPLDTVELRLEDVDAYNVDDMARIRLWIRHFLTCRVRVLTLDICSYDTWPELYGVTLISTHQRKPHLSGILFDDKLLDFSCCPALEVLEADARDFTYARTILSQSLKCLSINSDCRLGEDSRIDIRTPNLHSLRLEVGSNRTPLLNSMPFLMEAFVELSDDCFDYCPNNVSSGNCEDDDCYNCYGVDGDTHNSVLLHGLSKARSLMLISDDTFIFRRDLKQGPVFGNLRTLLLDEYWCVTPDFSALLYMLEHCPVLEKLTLDLYCTGPKSKLNMLKGIPHPTVRSDAMPEHIKTVEVKCTAFDDKVLGVLKFLSELGICFQF